MSIDEWIKFEEGMQQLSRSGCWREAEDCLVRRQRTGNARSGKRKTIQSDRRREEKTNKEKRRHTQVTQAYGIHDTGLTRWNKTESTFKCTILDLSSVSLSETATKCDIVTGDRLRILRVVGFLSNITLIR